MAGGRIVQVKVPKAVDHFKRGLMERWGLKDYDNLYDPCLFFGFYTGADFECALKHKGFKLIQFLNVHGNKWLHLFKDKKDSVVVDNVWLKKIDGIVYKSNVDFEIKDYSMFKPNVLGDKIYCYIGGGCEIKHGYAKARKLQSKLNFEIIYGKLGSHTIEAIKEKYYDKCFLNLNLSIDGGGGLTTVRELGCMGRMTVMNTKMNYPQIIPYKDENDLVRIINEESKKIGTVHPGFDVHTTGEEWLNIDFWKGKK